MHVKSDHFTGSSNLLPSAACLLNLIWRISAFLSPPQVHCLRYKQLSGWTYRCRAICCQRRWRWWPTRWPWSSGTRKATASPFTRKYTPTNRQLPAVCHSGVPFLLRRPFLWLSPLWCWRSSIVQTYLPCRRTQTTERLKSPPLDRWLCARLCPFFST